MKNLILVSVFCCLLICCKTNAESFDKMAANKSAATMASSLKASQLKNGDKSTPTTETADLNIGNVESQKRGACLKIQNRNLKKGNQVQIILADKPQQVLRAKIFDEKECENAETFDLNADKASAELIGDDSEAELFFYSLELSESDAAKLGFGIGVVNQTARAKIVKGLASIDIDGDGKDEYFRECASNEGLHLTVWTSKPLAGKRIWHTYYHFNYDTENDCKKKDYE